MSRSLLQLGALALVGASLLAGCDRRDENTQNSGSTTTASTDGRDAAGTGPADSTVSGTGMGGGNPNGQGTGDSSTRSNVPAGALPASGATPGSEGLNRGQTNSR